MDSKCIINITLFYCGFASHFKDGETVLMIAVKAGKALKFETLCDDATK